MNYGYTCMRPNEPFEPFCDGKIFIDQVGDVRMPAFEELTHVLVDGDLVTIPSLVCLGCTFAQICERWDMLRGTGARVLVLDYPDSQKADPETLDRIMEYMKKTQEQLRQSGTRPSLRRNFSQVGPKSKEIPAEFDMLSESYKQGRISSRAAAERLNISHTTYLRWCRTILPME